MTDKEIFSAGYQSGIHASITAYQDKSYGSWWRFENVYRLLHSVQVGSKDPTVENGFWMRIEDEQKFLPSTTNDKCCEFCSNRMLGMCAFVYCRCHPKNQGKEFRKIRL